mmetsp:Transcript_6639/g.16471  ORF Transcript_6639/g.16471 Transcript_6639/m.16471 type:complete len:376 (+) Transcript_6639:200-1327(+)
MRGSDSDGRRVVLRTASAMVVLLHQSGHVFGGGNIPRLGLHLPQGAMALLARVVIANPALEMAEPCGLEGIGDAAEASPEIAAGIANPATLRWAYEDEPVAVPAMAHLGRLRHLWRAPPARRRLYLDRRIARQPLGQGSVGIHDKRVPRLAATVRGGGHRIDVLKLHRVGAIRGAPRIRQVGPVLQREELLKRGSQVRVRNALQVAVNTRLLQQLIFREVGGRARQDAKIFEALAAHESKERVLEARPRKQGKRHKSTLEISTGHSELEYLGIEKLRCRPELRIDAFESGIAAVLVGRVPLFDWILLGAKLQGQVRMDAVCALAPLEGRVEGLSDYVLEEVPRDSLQVAVCYQVCDAISDAMRDEQLLLVNDLRA